MTWESICADKSLQDLPYKIETNRYSQIIMSPASGKHGILQGRITRYLGRTMPEGEVISECPIQTDEGVKVADVAWASDKYIEEFADRITFPEAPELCVEVISPSNSEAEMSQKRKLYFSQGAKEVWLCTLKGQVTFYTSSGEVATSTLFPAFPKEI